MATPHSSLRAMIAGATIFLCVAFAHPFPSLADQGVTLKGQVLTRDGQPIPSGVTVSLETEQGAMMGSRPVDAFGNYVFEGLAAGTYHLTVTADRFQVYQQDVEIDFRQQTYIVNVYLTPSNKTEVKVPPALTDEAAPKTARKEFEKGEHALKENKMPEARRQLEKAVADYPCYARAQASLAEVDLHDGKSDSAEACFKKAIQCDGSFLDSFSELAELYIVEKKFVESEAILNQGLRLSPQAWLFHYEMGQAHYGMQKYPESVQDFLLAQSLHPQVPAKFHIKLANAYLRTEAYPKALAEFQTYLRLEPSGQFAPAARQVSEMMLKGGITAAAASPPSTPAASKP
ncbi:MAG TPA: carboxypeptidase regulatory-like domain-containing protein [Terriglobia bacterium]|nr:carboxypeptidase regulatory-like domain-containing protein [Terriglobia bacterium]